MVVIAAILWILCGVPFLLEYAVSGLSKIDAAIMFVLIMAFGPILTLSNLVGTFLDAVTGKEEK